MNAMDNRHAIEEYFAVLKECLEKHDLMVNQARFTILFDEVGVPLVHRPLYTLLP